MASGQPFRVFTAFWKTCLTGPWQRPEGRSRKVRSRPASWPASLAFSELALEPKADWAGGFSEAWQPGESRGEERVEALSESGLQNYSLGATALMWPARPAFRRTCTSGRSAPARFGAWPMRRMTETVSRSRRACDGVSGRRSAGVSLPINCSIISRTPQSSRFDPNLRLSHGRPMRLAASVEQGKTGYPLVDAGMRELGTPAGCTIGCAWWSPRSW